MTNPTLYGSQETTKYLFNYPLHYTAGNIFRYVTVRCSTSCKPAFLWLNNWLENALYLLLGCFFSFLLRLLRTRIKESLLLRSEHYQPPVLLLSFRLGSRMDPQVTVPRVPWRLTSTRSRPPFILSLIHI